MQNNLKQFDYLTKIYNRNVSEDCLFLNIWTPIWTTTGSSSLTNVKDNQNITTMNKSNKLLLPVIIYIHGGGFNYMGISMEAYNGGMISAIGNVVFVTINYRVGLLGFFDNNLEDSEHTTDHYDRNLGLYDQITAIEWVRKNIHHFGGKLCGFFYNQFTHYITFFILFQKGDPNQITLQGQSAGAISIGMLMISPVSRNLFQRVILQSASPMMLKQIFTNHHFTRVIQLANCTIDHHTTENTLLIDDEYENGNGNGNDYNNDNGDDDNNVDDEEFEDDDNNGNKQRKLETECVERLTSRKINEIQGEILSKNIISFSPSIPSQLLPEYVEQQSDNIVQKDILIGANANESTLYLHHEAPDIIPLVDDFNVNLTTFQQVIDKLDSGSNNLERLSSLILDRIKKENSKNNEKQIIREFMVFLSDFIFKGPVFKFAKLLSDDDRKNVYLYLFHEENLSYPKWIGSPHWNEMDYVFGLPLRYPDKFTYEQQMLSRRMIQTWTNFARTG